MSTAEQNIDYSLIPTIEVARQLFGQESRERTHGDERHFDGHGGLFVNLKKNRWYSHGNARAAMLSASSASPTAAIIKPPSIGCGRMDTSHFSASGQHLRQIVATSTITSTADGARLYQIVRYEPKDFRQRATQTARAAGSGKAQRGRSLTSCPN